jgi:hypothetical protein
VGSAWSCKGSSDLSDLPLDKMALRQPAAVNELKALMPPDCRHPGDAGQTAEGRPAAGAEVMKWRSSRLGEGIVSAIKINLRDNVTIQVLVQFS